MSDDESIRLPIDGNVRRGDIQQRGSFYFGFVVAAFGVLFSFLAHSLVPLVLVAIGVAGIIVLDVPATRARRFGAGSRPFLVARPQGVEGDAYPLAWYSSIRGPGELNSHSRGGGVVVRSRFARIVAERADHPNFVSWARTTIVVFRENGKVMASLWGQTPPADNSVFHGVAVVIPEGALAKLLQFATAGGSDVHITMDLLSEAGSKAAVYCARHATRAKWSNFPITLPRVGVSSSYADYASWVRSTSASE